MTILKCFAIPGMKLWFWPNDHEPAHFHAKRGGEWEYKIRFLENEAMMFEKVWSKTKKTEISRQERSQIVEMVTNHRATIYKEWEKIHP